MNISLDNINVVVASQTKGLESGTCFQKIHIGDNEKRIAKSCENNLLYSSVKTIKKNQSICFTGTEQKLVDKRPEIQGINVSGCQILRQKEINDISSCEQLFDVYQELDKDQVLLSMILNCSDGTENGKQQCLVLPTSNSSSDKEDTIMYNCLPIPCSNGDRKKANPESRSFLQHIKKHMIPILAALGGVFFIIILVLANRVRKHHKRSGSRHPPESEPNMFISSSNEDNLYHEPDNHHTYAEVDETGSRNYEYAYGHLDVGTSRISGVVISVEPNPNCTNIIPDKPDLGKDYMNVDRPADKTYMEMESSYQPLDRSSMVDDNAMYQGLIQQKDRIRPKIAPKPGHLRRDEKPVVSYVKVM